MKNIIIYETAKIINPENVEFGNYVIIDDFVLIYAKKKIRIGNYVHIAGFSSITGDGELRIGDFVALSWGTRVFLSSDDFKDGGFGNSTISGEFRNIKRGNVIIEDFAIIGANSVILPGVKIGEGAAVGACSVVTKSLDPWGVYIGNKKIGERNRKKVMVNYNKFLKADFRKRVNKIFYET